MIRLWGTIRRDNRIVQDAMEELDAPSPHGIEDWAEALGPLCEKLDLSRPILLKKHIRELGEFSRAVFMPGDFMEDVDFDRFEVEIFTEKKR